MGGCFGGKAKPSRREEALQRIKSKRLQAAQPQTLPAKEAPKPQYTAFDPPAPKPVEPEGSSTEPATRMPKRSLSNKVLASLIKMPDPENVDRNRVTFDPDEEAEVCLSLPFQ